MLIVDTGVLVAAADKDDQYHAKSSAALTSHSGPLVTTAMVIAETAYLLERELGTDAELVLYDDIASGALRVEALGPTDWRRVRELVDAYRDLPLGGTDASLIAIAERLQATSVATIDHAHFRVVRPEHVEAFDLVVDELRPKRRSSD